LGIESVDVDIRDLSDEDAIILMVDSNMYRDKILPSEKAFAYKMKMDALKHQGKSLSPKGTKSHSVDEIEDTKTQIYRYIRLTNLIPELLQLVDDTVLKDKRTVLTMGIKPAVELSYLNKEEQKLVYMGITYEDLTPSHGQAIKIRQLAKDKKLTFDSLEDILCEQKGNQHEQISFNKSNIEKALPSELLKRDKRYIEQYIIKAIENYKKQELERGDAYDLDM
jgi:ParB family chromosome partitioning protein